MISGDSAAQPRAPARSASEEHKTCIIQQLAHVYVQSSVRSKSRTPGQGHLHVDNGQVHHGRPAKAKKAKRHLLETLLQLSRHSLGVCPPVRSAHTIDAGSKLAFSSEQHSGLPMMPA